MRHIARTTRASTEFIARLRRQAEAHLETRIARYLAEAGRDAGDFSRDELLAIVTGEVRQELKASKRGNGPTR